MIFYNGCLHVNLLFSVEVMIHDITKDDQLELILVMSSQVPIAISDATCCVTGRVTPGCGPITLDLHGKPSVCFVNLVVKGA